MASFVRKLLVLAVVAGSWRAKAQTEQDSENANRFATIYVRVEKMPSYLQGNSMVKVAYYCEEDGVVFLSVEIIVHGSSSLTRIFSKAWKCAGQGFNGHVKTKSVKLRLPKSVAYRPDYFNRDIINVKFAKVKVALYSLDGWKSRQSEGLPQDKGNILSRHFRSIQALPPYSRRFFSPVCRTWIFLVLQRSWRFSDSQICAVEAERVVFLNYPAVFSGMTTGILRTLQPFSYPAMENERRQRYTKPKLTLEFWIYILEYCPLSHYNPNKVCGLIIHMDQMGKLLTPSLFINDIGQIHVDTTNGVAPIGIKTIAPVPKNVWTRVVFTLEGRVWHLHVHYGPNLDQAFSIQYTYDYDMYYDDIEGYFCLGGMDPSFGSFVGYMGKAVIYRHKIVSLIDLPPPHPFHPMFELHLTRREEKCQLFLSWLDSAIGVYRRHLDYTRQQRTDACHSLTSRMFNDWSASTSQVCPLRHPHKRKSYRYISRLLRKAMTSFHLSQKFEGGDFEAYATNGNTIGNRAAFLNISQGLMDVAKNIVAEKGLKKTVRMIPLLKQAACLGNDNAMFYLAVMLNNGVGIAADEIQSLAFFMLGALNKHSLPTMAMGHRHLMGIDGAPLDVDTAYMYYRTAAEKSKDDREEHRDREVLTEGIRLIDDARMKAQTSEVGDLFLWLRNQAEKGVASARTELANMFYWGARGVQRNLENALHVYRAGAEAGHAESMFNYGIMQYRGMGGKANKTAGKELMQKAAELKDSNAISALGWIALTRDKNMTEALRLFTRAKKLKHPDSGYYLGDMYYNGLVPGSPVNWDRALEEYEWSALRQHLHAGVMLGYLLSRGTPKYSRNIVFATDWMRFIAEKNSDLAQPLRDALNAYRDGNMDLALYLYMMMADTGFEVASFNLAYLCELNEEGATSYLSKECQWRHYNLTTQRPFQFVDSYSYIKMGDYHWYGCQGKRNLSEAARFYVLAVLKKDPQALFNLAFMVEEGTRVDPNLWQMISIPPKKLQSNYSILIELYSRCRESPKSEAFIPCSLALARIYLLSFWQDYYIYMQITSYFGLAIITITTVFVLHHCFLLRREKKRQQEQEEEDRKLEEDGRRAESEPVRNGDSATEGGEAV